MKKVEQKNGHIIGVLLTVGLLLVAVSTKASTMSIDSISGHVRALESVKVTSEQGDKAISSVVPTQRLRVQELKQQAAVDISDAINHFAGVTLRDYGGAGGIKTVSVRGLGAAHTGVSYDGVTLSDVQTGQIDLSRFSLAGLSSLNLVVGDDFDLLQSARIAGAAAHIDLRTTQAYCSDAVGHKPNWMLHLEQGSFDRYNALLRWSKRLNQRWALSAVGNYLFSGNGYPYTLVNGLESTKEHRTNSRLNSFNAEVNATCMLERSLLDMKLYYYDNNSHLPGVVVYYNPYSNEKQHNRNFFAQTRWNAHLSNAWTAQAIAKWNWSESKYLDRNGIYPGGAWAENYWQHEAYASGVVSYAPNSKMGVSYAADYMYNSMSGNLKTANNIERHTILQSLTAKYALGPLQLNARLLASTYINNVENNEVAQNFTRLTPSVGLSYRPIEGELFYLRAFYKDIFRAPTFTESYYYHLGNPNLSPERTHQWGIGAAWERHVASWWPTMKLTLDGYINRVNDKIVSYPINLHTWRTLNVGKVRIHGLDATLTNSFQLLEGHKLVSSVNYTLQKVVDKTMEGSTTYDKQLAYVPEHSGSASLAYENPWVNVSAAMVGVSNRYATHEHSQGTRLEGYMEMNLSAWRELKISSLRGELRADLQNVTDKKYEVVIAYPMPGRAYRLSFTIYF